LNRVDHRLISCLSVANGSERQNREISTESAQLNSRSTEKLTRPNPNDESAQESLPREDALTRVAGVSPPLGAETNIQEWLL
jgi:hypothetical protein